MLTRGEELQLICSKSGLRGLQRTIQSTETYPRFKYCVTYRRCVRLTYLIKTGVSF